MKADLNNARRVQKENHQLAPEDFYAVFNIFIHMTRGDS